LIPGGHIVFAIVLVLTFASDRSNRLKNCRVATKLHWLHSALAGLDFACVLARRVKSTHPRARLSASGQTRKPQDWLAPKHPRDRLRHRSARPIHRYIPPAKFRRSAELVSATNAPLKFSAALRPSSPHPSRQDFDF
jgi:hypothetical protein